MWLTFANLIFVAGAIAFASPGFDARKQCLELTHGPYKFVSPGPGDIRGVCPGLNIMANQ
jgi:hypothetical protein